MNLSSGLPEAISNDEDIARFLTQSGHYNTKGVKHQAFLPEREARETSVSRHGREPSERLWKIGVQAANGRTLHGAAILKASAVRNSGVDVFSDEPPDFHAAIRGWPWVDDPDLQRARQKEIAIVIASKAEMVAV
jgi:hypothetical protein